MEEKKVYYKYVAGKLRPVNKEMLIEEAFEGPKGLKKGVIYAPASILKTKMKGWGWKLRPYGIKANLETTKDYADLEKDWWIIPVPDEEFKLIKTSHVVTFPKLLEAYWRQFPKSDVIWGVLDAGQPVIRDMALIVGNLAYDQTWRKKLRGIESNPFFAAGGKKKESEEFVEYTRKLVYDYMLSGEYGRQVHNPDMLWQISTNMLSSPAFFGYHTGFKSMAMSAKNYLNKIPATKTLTEYLYKRMPHKLAYLFKTVEDYDASNITKAVLKEIEPVVGKETLAGLVNKGFGKTQALTIMNERKIISKIINQVNGIIEPAWDKIPENQKMDLFNYWKKGKGVLGDEAKVFQELIRGGLEKLSGRFILKPEHTNKIQKIFRDVYKSIPDDLIENARTARSFLKKPESLVKGGDYNFPYMNKYFAKALGKTEWEKEAVKIKKKYGSLEGFLLRVKREPILKAKFLKTLEKEAPYLSRKMRLKFLYKDSKIYEDSSKRVFEFLSPVKVQKVLDKIDFSDTAKVFTKELKRADYIPHKLSQEVMERSMSLNSEPGKWYAKARSSKEWNPVNSDEVVKSIKERLIRPHVIQHYQKIKRATHSVGMDVTKYLKITGQEKIKSIIEASKRASLLPAAKKASIAKTAVGLWVDLVIVGRLPAFFILNTVDDSFRMMTGVVDGLAEGRRPTMEMVKHWNKYKTPSEVYGKGFATALAQGDVNRAWGFDAMYNGLKNIGIEQPEIARRVGFYKHSFFSHLDKMIRQGVPRTTAVQVARKAGIKDVDHWLFDYSRTLLFDQLVGKAAPFVKFYRNNWGLFAEQAVKNPWLVHSMSKAWTAFEAIGAEKMPEHLKSFHKLFGDIYWNPNYAFSWAPAWKALAGLDDKTLRDTPSRLERKFEKWEGYSKGFQKKMIEDDFEFAAYVRSKQIPGIAKFFKVVGELTPLAPWASLPLGAAGLMEPQFYNSVIPQSDLIHSLTGINIEPWLKEKREDRLKKRVVLEQVGQVIRGEEIDVDKAKQSAESRYLIRSAKKLITGGWLEKISDWEIDFYNGLNKLYSKETQVRAPLSEELKPIMDKYDIGPEKAAEVHIQGQITASKDLQKNFRRAVVENYPFLKIWFHLRDVEKLTDREKEMEEEKKKGMRFLSRTPVNIKNEIYKGLFFVKALTFHPLGEIGQKVTNTFINSKPEEWKKKFQSMSIEAKEYLGPILKENSPQWLRDLTEKDDPIRDMLQPAIPDSIPAILGNIGNRTDKIFDTVKGWLKEPFKVDQLEAANLFDYIKTIGRQPTDKELDKSEKVAARLKKTMNEYKSFRIETEVWLQNDEIRDNTFNKVRAWYRNLKAEDPALIEYWENSDYKAYHKICENVLDGKFFYGKVPTKLAEHTNEFIKAYLDIHNVDPHEKDPDRAVYENYLKVRDEVFEGQPFYKVCQESRSAGLKWAVGKWEDRRKGKVPAKQRKADLEKTHEERVSQARGMWNVIKTSGIPGQIVDELHQTDKLMFDTMRNNIDEFRPRIEMYKYENIDRGYLNLLEEYGYHSSILEEIPEKAYSRLAMKSEAVARLLHQEGVRIELPSAFDTVMRKKPEPPGLDIISVGEGVPERIEKTEPTGVEQVFSVINVPYEPMDPEIEREEIASIPRKPSPESFGNIVSLLYWGRKVENHKANVEGRDSTAIGAIGQALGAIGREFKTDPLAIAKMWPLASQTINLGIKAGAFPKEDIPRIQDAVSVTSSVMAGTVSGYKAASFLTSTGIGAPIGMVIGAMLFGLTSLKGIKDRKKAKEQQKEWSEERRKSYEKQQAEREAYSTAQMVRRQAVTRQQQDRTAKLAGEMYRKHLAAWTKEGLPMKKFKEQPDWFKSRFMKEFREPLRQYSKKPSYGSKVGLIRTIERALPKPRW